ncbi:MAG: cation:proton antiporter, partial [Mobilitalea sp.]
MIGQVEEVMHFTEFGVVMMLFLVGLELKPSLLWKLRVPILGMGGMQVVLSAAVISGVLLIFISWQQAVAIGLTLASSSTAIVLQTLKEKGLMNSPTGRSIFSVLLFQDMAVIPILAFMPLLATQSIHDGRHAEEALLDIASLPGYLQLIVTVLAILFIFLISKFASKPIFRAIAATRVREIFVAAALAMVVGISLLMNFVGLSPALGTFLAGVVLADSEYRHELESDIESFKGLLLGIFFISIGASLNFKLIIDEIALIGGIVAGLFILKAIVLYLVGAIFKIGGKEKSLFALCLAGGGEFAFVLFQFTKANGVLPESIAEPFISAVAISMFLS